MTARPPLAGPAPWLALTLAWLAGIGWLSSQPPFAILALHPGLDKLAHVAAFGLLGFLLAGLLHAPAPSPGWRGVALVVALVAAAGLLDELHQLLVAGRTFSFGDWTADLAGGVGVGIAGLVRRGAGAADARRPGPAGPRGLRTDPSGRASRPSRWTPRGQRSAQMDSPSKL